MPSKLEIRDPIHGFIQREPHEQEIIDTPVFQRLRKIKQLAMASLVYPGALHTRFDHSIGAFHVASRVAARLLTSSTEARLVRLAALLHDIGHGPYSHVSEDILERFAVRKKLRVEPGRQIHEVLTEEIILRDADLARLLSPKEREQVVGLLNGKWGDTVLKSIISGPLDVDKQDYLLRDSYFCGVKYGVYDLDRLGENLCIHEDGEDRFLALSSDGVHVLEQFVLARYYMTTQVYRHRLRLISDEMIIRGICLGITEDKIDWLRDLYSYDGSKEFITEYLAWNDERLTARILEKDAPGGLAKEFFRRLSERKLLKRIFSCRPSDFEDPVVRSRVFQGGKELRDALESLVASHYGLDPHFVAATHVKVKSVRAQAATTEGQVTILTPHGPRNFDQESSLFRSIDEAIQEQFLEVYAAVEYRDEKEKRRRRKEFYQEITEMIKELANPQSKLFHTTAREEDKI